MYVLIHVQCIGIYLLYSEITFPHTLLEFTYEFPYFPILIFQSRIQVAQLTQEVELFGFEALTVRFHR